MPRILAASPSRSSCPSSARSRSHPQRIPAGFHTDDGFAFESAVERHCFVPVQLPFRMLSCFCVDHSNLLETRMEITAYNLHDGSFRPSLGLRKVQVYSALLRAVVVMKSTGAGAARRRSGEIPRMLAPPCRRQALRPGIFAS